jgi:protein TonB
LRAIAAYSAQRERRFYAIVNAWGVTAAAAADVGSSVHDEIDNVLGSAAIATYLCPGLAEGGAGAEVTGSTPGGLPRSAVDSARQAAYGQFRPLDPPNWLLLSGHSRYRYKMHRMNARFTLRVRITHTVTFLLAFSQFAMSQSASTGANSDAVTVRISEDGICYLLNNSAPCVQLGKYLLTMHLPQSTHLHIAVDRASKYELVAATLESLEGTGFKVGFVNNEAPASPSEAPPELDFTKPNVTEDGQTIQSHPIHLGAQYYPPESRRLGEQGTCLVKITVTAEGEIRDVTLTKSTGYPRLDQACVDGFKGAHMRPAIRDGKAITLTKEIPVKWTLNMTESPPPPQ